MTVKATTPAQMVSAYASFYGISTEAARDRLVEIGFRRYSALQRNYNRKAGRQDPLGASDSKRAAPGRRAKGKRAK